MKSRRYGTVGAVVVLLIFGALSTLFAQGHLAGHKFMGVKQCRKCHRDEEKGNQYGQWADSKHAKAWEALASDKAKEYAKAAGIADPQKDMKCVKCHATGAEFLVLKDGKWSTEDKEHFDAKFKHDEGVQCESCHGAGSEYSDEEVMADHDKSVAAGMIVPDKTTCEGCHNKESPSFKEFDYEKMFEKVKHPRPKK